MQNWGQRGLPFFIRRERTKVKKIFDGLVRDGLLDLIDEFDEQYLSNPDLLPNKIINLFNRHRLFSLWIPKWLGGGGYHPASMTMLQEEFSHFDIGTFNILGAHYFALGIVSASLNLPVIRKISEKIRLGEKTGNPYILAAAITEPNAATDLEDLELLSKAQVNTCFFGHRGTAGMVSGSKIFISNAPVANAFITVCFTDKNNPHLSSTIVMIERTAKGVFVDKPERKLGQNTSITSSVFFDQVSVSNQDVIFSRGQFLSEADFLQFNKILLHDILSLSRASVAYMASELHLRTYEILRDTFSGTAIAEATNKKIAEIHGRALKSNALSWQIFCFHISSGILKDLSHFWLNFLIGFIPKLALNYIFSKLEPGKLLIHLRQLRLKRFSLTTTLQLSGLGALAKASNSSELMEDLHTAISMIGIRGLCRNHKIEKMIRDSALLEIYEGSTDINWLHFEKSFVQIKAPDYKVFEESIWT